MELFSTSWRIWLPVNIMVYPDFEKNKQSGTFLINCNWYVIKTNYSHNNRQSEFCKISLKSSYLFAVFILSLNIFANLPQDSISLFRVYVTNPKKHQQVEVLPLFLSAPDSICGLKVEPFLWGTDQQADSLLARSGDNCGTNIKTNTGLQFLFYVRSINQRKFKEAFTLHKILVKQKLPELLRYSIELNWCVASYMVGEVKLARKKLKKLEEKYRNREGTWKNLFSIYIGSGFFQKADELVEGIMDTVPSTIWAQESKINLIDILGTQSDLIEYLKEKSSWRDSLFAIQIAYASMLKKRKQNQLAINYYTRGLEGNPRNGEGWLELAELFLEEGQRDLTLKSMQMAIQAGIDNPIYFELLNKLIRLRMTQNFRLREIKKQDRKKCIQTWRPGYCQQNIDRYMKDVVDSNFIGFTKVIEHAFTQITGIRSLAQTLHILYQSLGRKIEARNLKSRFWFHFVSPHPVYYDIQELNFPQPPQPRLTINFSYISYPLIRIGLKNDWFSMPGG